MSDPIKGICFTLPHKRETINATNNAHHQNVDSLELKTFTERTHWSYTVVNMIYTGIIMKMAEKCRLAIN